MSLVQTFGNNPSVFRGFHRHSPSVAKMGLRATRPKIFSFRPSFFLVAYVECLSVCSGGQSHIMTTPKAKVGASLALIISAIGTSVKGGASTPE